MAADGEMLWYDLETTSPDPATCRITQFAAVRTTGGLDTISTASVTVRPDDWVLPTPEAVLVTGLTPEILARDGMPEYEGVLRIREALSAPGATRIGYNSVRFDDEVVRHTLYRGLHDPYELEWRGGAARYDLLDIVRAASVFEPSGVSWGRNGDGALSYSLGATAEANGIGFGGKQHDALADVAATVDLAKVFRDGAPRTWGHAMLCRDKRFVGRVVGTGPSRLLFHSSRLHGNERRCGALVVPVCAHPSIPNRVIGVDVGRDDDALHGMSGGELRDALFAKDGDRAAGSPRPPLVLLETNKPMFVAEIKKGGDPPWAARIGADIGAARARQKRIRDAGAPLADKLKTARPRANCTAGSGNATGAARGRSASGTTAGARWRNACWPTSTRTPRRKSGSGGTTCGGNGSRKVSASGRRSPSSRGRSRGWPFAPGPAERSAATTGRPATGTSRSSSRSGGTPSAWRRGSRPSGRTDAPRERAGRTRRLAQPLAGSSSTGGGRKS